MKGISALVLLAWATSSLAADDEKWPPTRWDGWCEFKWDQGRGPPPVLNLPSWACEIAFERGLHKKYSVFTGLNPFYVSGDFNADGHIDVAVWISNIQTKERGVVILHQRKNDVVVIGAGTDFFERGKDYSWVDLWSVIPKGKELDSVWEDGTKVNLRGDALELTKSESSSHAIYWDGKKYKVYWLSD